MNCCLRWFIFYINDARSKVATTDEIVELEHSIGFSFQDLNGHLKFIALLVLSVSLAD